MQTFGNSQGPVRWGVRLHADRPERGTLLRHRQSDAAPRRRHPGLQNRDHVHGRRNLDYVFGFRSPLSHFLAAARAPAEKQQRAHLLLRPAWRHR